MSVTIPSLRGAIAVPSWAKNELWRKARAVPSLDLRFADSKSLVDARTGQSLVTFTRASSGTFVGSDGLIATASTDVPRFDHNPTTGESLGLLVEEQRTNLLLRSEDYSTTWFTSNLTRTGNTTDVTAPDGQITASKFVVATGGALGQGVISTAVSHTGSIYLRTDSGTTTVDLLLYRNSPFQLVQTANVTVTSAWQRFSVTGAFVDTTAHNLQVNFGSNKTVYAWGAQLEVGAFPTSYIKTETAAATRSADIASITGTNFSGWYRQDEGSLLTDCSIAYTIPGTSFPISASLNDGTVNNRIENGFLTTGLAGYEVVAGGFAQVGIYPSAGSASTRRLATTYQLNNFAASVNGGTVSTDTSGTVPTVDRLRMGDHSSGSALNGTIRRLCFWPTRLANETLQRITQ